jgi:hypothetical protein
MIKMIYHIPECQNVELVRGEWQRLREGSRNPGGSQLPRVPAEALIAVQSSDLPPVSARDTREPSVAAADVEQCSQAPLCSQVVKGSAVEGLAPLAQANQLISVQSLVYDVACRVDAERDAARATAHQRRGPPHP